MAYELFEDCVASLSILGGHIDAPYHLCPAVFENVTSNSNSNSGISQQTSSSSSSSSSSSQGNATTTTERPYSHHNSLNTNYGIISRILPNDVIEIMTTSDNIDHNNNSNSNSSSSNINKDENSNNNTIHVPWDKVQAINRCPIDGLNISSALVEAVLILTYKLVLNPFDNKNEIKNIKVEKEAASDIILCSKNKNKETETERSGRNDDSIEGNVVIGEIVRESIDLSVPVPLPLSLPLPLSPAAPAVVFDSITVPRSSFLLSTSLAVDNILSSAVSTIATANTNSDTLKKIENKEEEKERGIEIGTEVEIEADIEIDKKEKKNSDIVSKFILRYISLLSARASSSLSSILPAADHVQNILTRNILQASENVSMNNVPSPWKVVPTDFLVNLLKKAVQMTKSAGEYDCGFSAKKSYFSIKTRRNRIFSFEDF